MFLVSSREPIDLKFLVIVAHDFLIWKYNKINIQNFEIDYAAGWCRHLSQHSP